MHSKKPNIQLLVKALQQVEVQHIIISPGSRNAPLSLAFSTNKNFTCYSVVDERCAAFFALGKAQQLQEPIVICCTSGSAIANYFPAITEAFYQNIPIIVISADRPENYVDIFDGQTIRQKNFLASHSYYNTQLTEGNSKEILVENVKKIETTLEKCFQEKGPVHINLPMNEPLYETNEKMIPFVEKITISVEKQKKYNNVEIDELQKIWQSSSKKMILCGMLHPNEEMENVLSKIAEDESVVILTETTSNVHHPNIFSSIDKLIFNLSEQEWASFAPDILLTIGQNIVSKKIKQMLRSSRLEHHWHIDEHWQPDTFFQLTEKILYPKKEFLQKLYRKENPSHYYLEWKNLKLEKKEKHQAFLKESSFSDLKVFDFLYHNLPENSQIQFANSTAIRYSQLFEFNKKQKVFCNRGTSGIEGSTSTAIGAALHTTDNTFLVTGDISFFYDSNALWNNYIPNNFKIILINNGGGDIFNFISGPEKIPEKDIFLTTQHFRTAKKLAEEYQFSYLKCNNFDDLDNIFSDFLNLKSKTILEINTSMINNSKILQSYFKK